MWHDRLFGDARVRTIGRTAERLWGDRLPTCRTLPTLWQSACPQTLGLAARGRIQSNFSIDAKADEWETLYTTILERDG